MGGRVFNIRGYYLVYVTESVAIKLFPPRTQWFFGFRNNGERGGLSGYRMLLSRMCLRTSARANVRVDEPVRTSKKDVLAYVRALAHSVVALDVSRQNIG